MLLVGGLPAALLAASWRSAPDRIAAPPAAVVLADTDGDDSVAVILRRDLAFSDRVVVTDRIAPGVTIVRARVTPHGYHVAVLDSATGAVREARDFAVPRPSRSRAPVLRDSIDAVLAAHTAARGDTLRLLAARRDSVARERRRGHGFFWTRSARRRWSRRMAHLDALAAAIPRQEARTRAAAGADSALARAALHALLAADSTHRAARERARRWAIHGVADVLVRWLSGVTGTAQSRIAYVTGGELHVVDADGANDHAVTHAGRALSPAWRRDGGALAYTDLAGAGTQIAWVELATGRTHLLHATRRGLNITPTYSPDGAWLYFATGDEHHTTLVAARVDGTGPLRHIGRGGSWDEESPVFNPDGSRIAFVSSRPGSPEIYSERLDGTDLRLETPIPPHRRPYRTGPD